MSRQKEFVPEEVLERAMLTFWHSGYEATSTSELAAQMGIGKRSMYDTFGDKHALYLAALRLYMRQSETQKEETALQAGSLAEALRVELGPPPQGEGRPAGCFATLAAADAMNGDVELQQMVTAHFHRSRARVRAQIRRFAGSVSPDAEDAVMIACDAAVGYRVRARTGEIEPGQIDRMVEYVCASI